MSNKFQPESQALVSYSLMGPESGGPCLVAVSYTHLEVYKRQALGDALGDLAVGVVQVAEDQGLVGTGLHASGFLAGVVRIVQQVGAHGAFLGDLLLLVPVHRAHRAGVHDLALALGLDGIDDDDAVLALVYRPVLGRSHAGGVVAVGARSGDGGGLDAPLVVPPLPLPNVHPELAHVGLGLGNGGVPAAVLVLACLLYTSGTVRPEPATAHLPAGVGCGFGRILLDQLVFITVGPAAHRKELAAAAAVCGGCLPRAENLSLIHICNQ